jgi:hypothetical protein
VLRAAETISKRQNRENPELYAVFPYRLFGLGKPDLDIGRATYEARDFRETGGWQQDSIQAALLGLTQEARKMVAHNFSTKNPRMRFPAFWGPNFDWTPDQDHGNVAMIAMQRMLLQFEGDRMTLFPAWPKEWDVEFRLWGPRRTSVEGIWRGGKLEKLTVTPEARRKDLTIGEPQ